jgi:hypothetical protein
MPKKFGPSKSLPGTNLKGYNTAKRVAPSTIPKNAQADLKRTNAMKAGAPYCEKVRSSSSTPRSGGSNYVTTKDGGHKRNIATRDNT